MKLVEYIRPMSAAERSAFAQRCKSTPAQIQQLAYGRRASAELAIRIDIASEGQVSCEEMRPDINWAYLRDTTNESAA